MDYMVGMSPLFSHVVNLAWHVACALLLYALASRLLLHGGWHKRRAALGAFISALTFTVLPANVEAVAWFAARADMVATAGALSALLLLMRFQELGRLGDYIGALLGFALGLFCKESLLTFPLVAWLWLRFLGIPDAGRKAIPFWGVLLVYVAMRTAVVGGAGAYPQAWETLQRPWLLLVNLLAYLFQMGMPAILYGLGRDGWDTLLWGVWAVGVGFLMYALRAHRSRHAPPISGLLILLLVLAALLPVLIFKPSPFYFLNSRYTYLASAFALTGMSAWLAQLAGRGAMSGLIIILMTYTLGTIRQAVTWAEAGKIARSSVLSLIYAPTEHPLLILSVPDHFHGAYIWRAGFHEGVALLLPERANQPIFVASRFTMRLRRDVAVGYANGVATLSSPDDIFLPPEGVRTPEGDEPMVLPNQLVIHWSQIERYTLLGFGDGQFKWVNVKLRGSE
ncbi:MAG: hypothetical protein KatS3mg020_0829 [Fimbriimonadales bacterium]|nr:MAG: hypothetical protein KatS3mg019_0376 [Fimbriimonadales bacterium]GIV11338.1 MAG: hypothetical protein KatS3mg020_0829 [Fimbriimonadales bacterium]